jgi:hypothetical protein
MINPHSKDRNLSIPPTCVSCNAILILFALIKSNVLLLNRKKRDRKDYIRSIPISLCNLNRISMKTDFIFRICLYV